MRWHLLLLILMPTLKKYSENNQHLISNISLPETIKLNRLPPSLLRKVQVEKTTYSLNSSSINLLKPLSSYLGPFQIRLLISVSGPYPWLIHNLQVSSWIKPSERLLLKKDPFLQVTKRSQSPVVLL
jgi:hypothetical protein